MVTHEVSEEGSVETYWLGVFSSHQKALDHVMSQKDIKDYVALNENSYRKRVDGLPTMFYNISKMTVDKAL